MTPVAAGLPVMRERASASPVSGSRRWFSVEMLPGAVSTGYAARTSPRASR
jgi:hypothetical protein